MSTNKTISQYILKAIENGELEEFLDLLFTQSEINEFEKRISITQMLLNGHTQREIAKELKVGIATVTRGAKAITLAPKFLERQNENPKD